MSLISNTIVWLILGIAIPIYFLKERLGRQLTYNATEGAGNDGPITRPTRLEKGQPLVTSPDPSIKTLYDVLLHGVRVYPASRHLFGKRTVIGTVEEEKQVTKLVNGVKTQETKKWSFFKLSHYEWLTYRDVQDITTKMGQGLVSLGLKQKDKVAIFHSTSSDWMLMAFACYSQNIVITTAYDNLGVEALAYSLNEGSVSTLYTQADLMHIVATIGTTVPSLKHVVYTGKVAQEKLEEMKKKLPELKFVSVEQLVLLGVANPVQIQPPTPDDLCCIMYTSGSTGNPKGVMLKHANMVASVAGGNLLLGAGFTGNDRYLGYLPLAHVLEYVLEMFCVYKGVAIGYGSPRTLTDASVRDSLGDIRELRPTVMAGVPAVWETIRKGVMQKLDGATPTQKAIFDFAFGIKKQMVRLGLPTKFINKTIFKKVSDSTGGCLKIIVSGGAPIAAETQEFLSMTICPVYQGYGLTEVCGILFAQPLSEIGSYGNVGVPSSCTEIKLVKSGVYNPNPTNSTDRPSGEVWCRGPSIMQGYFNQPEITKENLTDDGWFMTGDIGQWNEDGTMSIIDRKKNLVKLSHGEYVALEKLESQYRTSKYVLNMCVIADPTQSMIVALIVPERNAIKAIQSEHQIDESNIKHAEIIKALQADLLECAKKAGFKGAEVLKNFTVLDKEFTAENGLLTAAQKIQRKNIAEEFQSDIDRMYGK